jgi:(2Fe-2S) ferredoxin
MLDRVNMSESIEAFVCTNTDCRNRGAAEVLKDLSERAQVAEGVWVVIKPYMCFSACNIGPNVVVPARRCWFSGVRAADVASIIAYLQGGADLPHLTENSEPELREMIFAIIDAGLMTDPT